MTILEIVIPGRSSCAHPGGPTLRFPGESKRLSSIDLSHERMHMPVASGCPNQASLPSMSCRRSHSARGASRRAARPSCVFSASYAGPTSRPYRSDCAVDSLANFILPCETPHSCWIVRPIVLRQVRNEVVHPLKRAGWRSSWWYGASIPRPGRGTACCCPVFSSTPRGSVLRGRLPGRRRLCRPFSSAPRSLDRGRDAPYLTRVELAGIADQSEEVFPDQLQNLTLHLHQLGEWAGRQP